MFAGSGRWCGFWKEFGRAVTVVGGAFTSEVFAGSVVGAVSRKSSGGRSLHKVWLRWRTCGYACRGAGGRIV